MYICAVANQKGGVGKTTTAHNLGMVLAQEKKVLLIDLDAQGNLTDACGFTQGELNSSTYELLGGGNSFAEVVRPLGKRIDLLPATKDLAAAELAFASKLGRENLLKKALKDIKYEFVIIDCPPSLGLLTVNALTAANGVLIPVQAEYYALAGLDLIQESMQGIAENINSDLHTLGILLTFFDGRKSLNREVAKGLRDRWGNLVFDAVIRDNVALAEAPSYGKSIFDHRSQSFGAQDYAALAKEFAIRVKGL